jgi:hypothetical protein
VPTDPAARGKSLPALVGELRELVVDYAKQQTVDPIKQVGRYVGFGVAGAFLLGIGVVFLSVGGLRALQDETGDRFSGRLTWVPYIVTVVGLLIGGALAITAINRGRNHEEGG